MKKLLSILASVGLSATAGAAVVACGQPEKEEKSDFTIKIAADNAVYVGVQGKLQIDDYENVAKKFEKFNIILPSEGEGSGVVEKVGDFNGKGELTLKGIKEGTVKVQIKAIEKAKPATLEETKPVEKFSNTLEIKVTIAGLGIVKITDVKREVSDIKNVTVDEANKASLAVIAAVDNDVTKIISGAKLGTDYTMDLTTIKAGDMSKGATIDVKAKEGSTLIKKDSKTSVKVIFTKMDTRVGLDTVTFDAITVKDLENNVKLTEADVTKAQGAVKGAVNDAIIKVIAEAKFDVDYTIDFSKVVEGADLSNKDGFEFVVKAKEGSKWIKEGTENIIKAIFTTIIDERSDLGTIDMPTLPETKLENSAALTGKDLKTVQDVVKGAVNDAIIKVIAEAKFDVDYTIDFSKVVEGADLSNKDGFEFVVKAKEGSKWIKEGTENIIKAIFTTIIDERSDLGTIDMPTLPETKLENSAALTGKDLKTVQDVVKGAVNDAIIKVIAEAKFDVDYTIDFSKVVEGADLSNKDGFEFVVKAKEGSKWIKEGTENIIKAIFTTIIDERSDLGTIDMPTLPETKLENSAALTGKDLKTVQDVVKGAVNDAIIKVIAEAKFDVDYTIDFSKVVEGADLSNKDGFEFVVKAKERSKWIKEGTENIIKAIFG